jgi:polygalacturonase
MKQPQSHGSSHIKLPTLVLLVATCGCALSAQDTRPVKEPKIPPSCTILKATMTSAGAASGEYEIRADRSGSDQTGLDTARLQTAFDHCPGGNAVELAVDGADNAFLITPVALRPGVTLLIDKGVTLFASRNPESYAIKPGSCGVVNDAAAGCKPLITMRVASGSAIMGDGTIDGQGGAGMFLDGQLSTKSWWALADQARSGGHAQAPRMIDTDLSDDVTLYHVRLLNSPDTNLVFHRGDGLTVWGARIDSPRAARNTDGIDLEQSKNITVTQSFIRVGNENLDIKAGDGATTNVSITHNHFYWGHGMSIGPATLSGVSQVRAQDLSIDGADDGIHIRSGPNLGGLVDDITYDDVCIRDAKDPISLDTAYSFPGKGAQNLPVYQDITLHDVRITGGGRIQFNGFDDTHRIDVTLDGVLLLDRPDRYAAEATHTDVTFGPGPVNLVLTGDDATAKGKEMKGSLPGCGTKFVPFP